MSFEDAFSDIDAGRVSKVEEENEAGEKRFKMCYSDHDTHVVRCAKLMQSDYIEVKHIASGRTIEFKNKTQFGIRSDKIIALSEEDIANNVREKEGQPYKWLAWKNYDQRSKNAKEFCVEDFEVLPKARLNPDFKDFDEALQTAEMIFASHIKALKVNMDSEDYTLLISGGNGNYRDYESKTIGYKSERGDKPIYFQEFKDKIAQVYKNKIWWADYCEAEDLIQYIAKQQVAKYGYDQGKWDSCATYVDKDVLQCYIPARNYDKYEDGWFGDDLFYCEKTLVSQTISGDPTDTIQGLPTLTEATTKYFGLRKANGVSKATAEKILEGSETFQEMWKRAIFCYQQYYGFNKIYDFKDVHGEDQSWTWLDYMQQCYVLVKMQEYEGQIPSLSEYLSQIGVDYTQEIKYGEVEVDTEGLVENLLICKDTLNELETLLKSYKSLPKPKLVEKLDEAVKLKDELKGNISLLEV